MAKKINNLSISIRNKDFGVPTITKESIEGTAGRLYDMMMDGDLSPLSVAEFIKFTEDVTKILKSLSDETGNNKFVDLVRDDIIKNSNDGKSCLTNSGLKLSLTEAGTEYDYSECNDPIWNNLKIEIDTLNKTIKARQEFLRTIQGSMLISIPDPLTGELIENIEIFPPIKKSTSTYKAEIPKS